MKCFKKTSFSEHNLAWNDRGSTKKMWMLSVLEDIYYS